jgi:hypothetical protein
MFPGAVGLIAERIYEHFSSLPASCRSISCSSSHLAELNRKDIDFKYCAGYVGYPFE